MTTTRNLLVVAGVDDDGLLANSLQGHGYQVLTWPLQALASGDSVKTLQPDAVIFNVYAPNPEVLALILDINQHCAVPIIVFAEDQQTETINHVIAAGVSAYIVDGLAPKRLKSIVDIAIARFTQHQALKNELEKTKTQLEDRKLVDKAKGLLMQSQGFSEAQAFHALRKLAMERGLSLGDMAKTVIAMAALLK